MRFSHKQLRPLPIVLALQAALCSPLWAAGFTVDAGTVDNAPKTISSVAGDSSTSTVNGSLSVFSEASGGTKAVATIIFDKNSKGADTLINNGTIEATSNDEDARAIQAKDNTGTVTIINNGTISAAGSDVIKMGKKITDLMIDNQGTIWQKGKGIDAGQGMDLADFAGASATIKNGSASNTAAVIRSDTGDAIAAGNNMHIINYGTIISNGQVNTKCRETVEDACDDSDAPSPHDGIDADKSTGVVIDNYGTISGPRHGITADVEIHVTNYAGAKIIGRNGSGIGTDGTGYVENYGLISGRYAGAGKVFDHSKGGTIAGVIPSGSDGDGDGVDIDGVGTIINHGRIEGLGGGGSDANGFPNGGDGIAMGGGTVANAKGASIWGDNNGILVDDGANGQSFAGGRGTEDAAPDVVKIANDGEIIGNKKVAIGLVGDFDDEIVNGSTGVIIGGANTVRVDEVSSVTKAAAIQMGGGNDTLTNYGRIEGKNGMAIDMGDGDDTLRLFGGTVIGTINGGSGVNGGINALETDGTQSFNAGQLSNFQNITIKGGTTTFNSALTGVDSITVDRKGSLSLIGTSGNVTVDGTLKAPAGANFGKISIDGNYTQNASGVLETRIGLNGASDMLAVANTATLADGATIRPMINGYIADGASYTVVDAGTLATTADNLKIDGTSNFLTYTLEKDGNDLKLVAHRENSFASLVPTGIAGVAKGLEAVFSTGSQESIDLVNAFESLPDAKAVAKATAQLAPETNAAAQSASMAAQGSVFSAFDNRIDTMRNGSVAMNQTGLAAGDSTGGRFWIQGLASVATQKARKGANGFDLDAQGLAVGFETDLNARDMVGLSGGYTQAGSDGRDDGAGDDNDVKALHIGGYFSRTDSDYTLDTSVALSSNRYSSQRQVSIPGFAETLNAKYSGYQVGLRAEYGIPFALDAKWSGRWLMGARLAHLDNDGYTENGGVSAQRVDSASANSVQSVLGVEFVNRLDTSSSATLRARYLHEFADTPAIDASFVNGGPSFRVDGVQPGREALQLGLGYRSVTSQGTVISIGYDLEVRDKFLGHQLTAKATWNF